MTDTQTETFFSANHTETFVEYRRKHGHTFETEVTIERTPASLSDLDSSHWLEKCGGADNVANVTRCKVYRSTVVYPDGKRYVAPTKQPVNQGYEVRFRSGALGFVVAFNGYSSLTALITPDRKCYLNGTWRKYGMRRGHQVAWAMAQPSKRKRYRSVDSNKSAPECCPLELYKRAQGQQWGSN
jgi:hypothetical protein